MEELAVTKVLVAKEKGEHDPARKNGDQAHVLRVTSPETNTCIPKPSTNQDFDPNEQCQNQRRRPNIWKVLVALRTRCRHLLPNVKSSEEVPSIIAKGPGAPR